MTGWECFSLVTAFLVGAHLVASSIGENASAMSDLANAIRELNSGDEE